MYHSIEIWKFNHLMKKIHIDVIKREEYHWLNLQRKYESL